MSNQYPPVGFHFIVRFEDFSEESDTRFQEVSGLSATVNTEDYREGGENRFTHQLPNGVTFDKLVLKRGLITDSKIIQWCKKAVENFQFEPKNLLVSLLNDEHEELCSWNVVNAYPVRWVFSGLHAERNELMIETLDLNYHYFTFKGGKGSSMGMSLSASASISGSASVDLDIDADLSF